jgi:hypothetical protein
MFAKDAIFKRIVLRYCKSKSKEAQSGISAALSLFFYGKCKFVLSIEKNASKIKRKEDTSDDDSNWRSYCGSNGIFFAETV